MGKHRSAIQALTPLLAVVCLVACEEMLHIEDKGRLTPENTSSDLLVAGAIRDFTVAYSGKGGSTTMTGGRFLVSTALLADELYTAESVRGGEMDQRAQNPISHGNYSDGGYIWLHRARQAAKRAFVALEDEAAGDSRAASEMKFLEAMTYVALGEGFCSGLPFSELAPDGTLVYGVPLSTSQVFEEAIRRFDEALAIDSDNDAAKIGKAWALMNLGKFQGAATVIASVPTTVVRQIHHSAEQRELSNPVFRQDYGVGTTPGEPDPVRDRRDPRILFSDAGNIGPHDTRVYVALKYSEKDSPVTLADGIEARLIEAEADLATGGERWLDILNALRANVQSLMADRIPDYEMLLQMALDEGTVDSGQLESLLDPGTTDARVDLIFSERVAWMYLTGHRLGDLRRLIRQYGRTPEDVFPSGPYFLGGSYGTDVVLPLAHRENDNPNWSTGMCSYNTP